MTGGIDWRIRQLETTVSTNAEIKQALDAGEPEGLVVCARQQTGGYGRHCRGWISPAGGLYLSLLLRPRVDVSVLPTLSLVVSLSVRRTLTALVASKSIMVKWPNDLIVPSDIKEEQATSDEPFSYSKLCGISLESHNKGICIGIGINGIRPDQALVVGGKNIPAYLSDLGYTGSIEALRTEILGEFETTYSMWQSQGFVPLQEEYNEHLALKGSPVAMVNQSDETMVEGTVVSVDDQGRLTLRAPDDSEISVFSGEVHLL